MTWDQWLLILHSLLAAYAITELLAVPMWADGFKIPAVAFGTIACLGVAGYGARMWEYLPS